jgi:hypothetical protein
MRSRTCCLARSIAVGSCSGWVVSGCTPLVERHQGEEPFRHVLHNRLVAPGAELADGCRLGSAFRPSLTGFAWSSLAKPPMIHPEGSACSKA